MTAHDRYGMELAGGDYVRTDGITDELFQIDHIRDEGVAVIRNVLPGGRLGTSSIPCSDLERAINNPGAPMPPWASEYGPEPVRGTELICGCYIRRGDLEAVLCEQHLIETNR